jgi:hypothetical protein
MAGTLGSELAIDFLARAGPCARVPELRPRHSLLRVKARAERSANHH